jgi:hypothetical protein
MRRHHGTERREGEDAGDSRRRGRPAGSFKLTQEIEETIVSYITAGSADYVAAEAAGLSARTFRHYLKLGSEEGGPPRLVRFAGRVTKAKAESRAAREIVAAERHVPFWLTHMAPSRPGRPGWTAPVEEEDPEAGAAHLYVPTIEEAAETLRILVEAGVLSLDGTDSKDTRGDHDEQTAV